MGRRRHRRGHAEGVDDTAGPGARLGRRTALDVYRVADLRTRYWDWTYRTKDGPYYLRFCGTPPVTHLFGLLKR